MFLLYLHDASDEHREAVQEIVKTHATRWSHHLPDVWIAGGHDHKYWANLISPVLALSDAGLLVLKLPNEKGKRMFATRGNNPDRMLDWLWSTYHGKERPKKALGVKVGGLPKSTGDK
ncbi:MAG TPA: hypothetical protein VFR75_08310 [Solirubrobacterales bacterium]|nr:hypothetical protein [Solirubrobacterales bacterium]